MPLPRILPSFGPPNTGSFPAESAQSLHSPASGSRAQEVLCSCRPAGSRAIVPQPVALRQWGPTSLPEGLLPAPPHVAFCFLPFRGTSFRVHTDQMLTDLLTSPGQVHPGEQQHRLGLGEAKCSIVVRPPSPDVRQTLLQASGLGLRPPVLLWRKWGPRCRPPGLAFISVQVERGGGCCMPRGGHEELSSQQAQINHLPVAQEELQARADWRRVEGQPGGGGGSGQTLCAVGRGV